ncbi:MAG: hypothetical protein ACYSOW_11345 [Planctomycetota bacterium]|jgi:hypothetical protein
MKNFSLTLAMIALMFTSISQAAYTIDRFPVYDGPDDQTNPDIDGDMIVWQSSDTDIYYKHIDAADLSRKSAMGLLSGWIRPTPITMFTVTIRSTN